MRHPHLTGTLPLALGLALGALANTNAQVYLQTNTIIDSSNATTQTTYTGKDCTGTINTKPSLKPAAWRCLRD